MLITMWTVIGKCMRWPLESYWFCSLVPTSRFASNPVHYQTPNESPIIGPARAARPGWLAEYIMQHVPSMSLASSKSLASTAGADERGHVDVSGAILLHFSSFLDDGRRYFLITTETEVNETFKKCYIISDIVNLSFECLNICHLNLWISDQAIWPDYIFNLFRETATIFKRVFFSPEFSIKFWTVLNISGLSQSARSMPGTSTI